MAKINDLLCELQGLAHDYSFPRLAEIAAEIKSSLSAEALTKDPLPGLPADREASLAKES